MRAVRPVRSRRTAAAWLLFIAVAIAGACDGASSPTLDTRTPLVADGAAAGDTTHVPGDTTHVPGDTTHVPGDTTHVPGDTTHVPGDTTHVPGDTTGVPGDTTGVPGDTTGVPGDTTGVPGDTTSGPELAHFTVEVWIQADTTIIPVSGAVVTLSRGASNQVIETRTTGSAGTVTFAVKPGEYTVRLASLPPGVELRPGQSGEQRLHLAPGGEAEVRFFVER